MAIHNKSHNNSALRSILFRNKENIKNKTSKDFDVPECSYSLLMNKDCLEMLKQMPDESVQLILIDPPYNLDLASWDTYDNYMSWASYWLEETYRVLSKSGSLVIFGGTQFRDERSGDLTEIVYHCRHNTKWKLVNTVVWYYKNGMSAHRYFANRHEEAIWLVKTDKYYFDLDSVRVKYSDDELNKALRDKRLIPENVMKGKNPTNVWEIGRLNGNSLERVGHPTQKPLEILDKIILASTKENDLILDPFCGSSTTGISAVKLNRTYIGIDNEKEYIGYNIRNTKTAYGIDIDQQNINNYSAITVEQVSNTEITVKGIDKELVGQTAAVIRTKSSQAIKK